MSHAPYRKLFLLALVVAGLTLLCIGVKIHHLPNPVPQHFNLQGISHGSMPLARIWTYPMLSAGLILLLYILAHCLRRARRAQCWQHCCGLAAVAAALIILSSTCVTLTLGQSPIFMLAEPLILLLALVGIIFCWIKQR
ncbi:MAG: hypothetical protein MJZ57_02465 [Bacteroidales bacterium]|nr:hypothetical protein [Bacteroidales bacterium]